MEKHNSGETIIEILPYVLLGGWILITVRFSSFCRSN